jgi:hypothetical protein
MSKKKRVLSDKLQLAEDLVEMRLEKCERKNYATDCGEEERKQGLM